MSCVVTPAAARPISSAASAFGIRGPVSTRVSGEPRRRYALTGPIGHGVGSAITLMSVGKATAGIGRCSSTPG